jgi:hypothetical protein
MASSYSTSPPAGQHRPHAQEQQRGYSRLGADDDNSKGLGEPADQGGVYRYARVVYSPMVSPTKL